MATLEKIRSKSVLLIIVIGVALLAFIIGDAITNSRNLFGEQSTVAKIGSKKIDYTDFVQKREELNSQLEMMRKQNPAQAEQIDVQTLSQEALTQLVNEALIDEAVEKAGIKTSPNQLKFYIFENPINVTALRNIMTALGNSGYAVQTPAQAYDVIFNPENHGLTRQQMEPLQRLWVNMETQTAQMVARNTYQQLLGGTFRANKLDKQALYDDYVSTQNIDFVYLPYRNDEIQKYEVADAAARAEYENMKGKFKVDELTKDVAFIAVNVLPSSQDVALANALANKTVTALKSSAGIGKDLRKEGILSTTQETLVKNLNNGPVKDFVATAPVDSVKVVSQNRKGFTIVKMKKRTNAIDSIQINLVQAPGSISETVLARLNGGLAVDSLVTVFKDSVQVTKDEWITLYNKNGWTGSMDKSQLDTLLNAGGKYVSLLNTPDMALMAKVVSRVSPKEIVEYEEVTYDLKPSQQTLTDEITRLEAFLEANPTASAFVENASQEGYRVNNISLSSDSPAVPTYGGKFYPDSRQVVRWVMIDGKPGQVSHIYESKDALNPQLYAVAVIDEYDDYRPLTNEQVNKAVADRVRKSQAGDALVAQYQPNATSMANISAAMNIETVNDSTFRFGRGSKVRDAAVMGKIAGSKPGKVVLVKGDNGVYAYQIISNGKSDFEYNDNQYDRQYTQMVQPDFYEMLRGGKNYKNNIYKFEAGD